MVQIEGPGLNSEGEETWQDLEWQDLGMMSDEHVRKAFALLLSSVDVEDVFGEYIVPSDVLSGGGKEAQ